MGMVVFESHLVLTACASERRATKVSVGVLHGGVEVGWVVFECRSVLTDCASERRGTKVSMGVLHGGVEVGWRGSKRRNTYTLTAEGVANPDAA